ncbi:leucyl aminopeptidase family protein [Sphingomonas sp. ASV193]|uniref:leucyl aminopeptidase family protein n=1 Tax=Sphingomonas sp. ASV193 TaxID=3144405 RepID=UPI0032E87D19
MTEFTALLKPDRGEDARTIHLVDKHGFDDWLKRQTPEVRALLAAARFDGKSANAYVLLPARGEAFDVVLAVADAAVLTPWCLARLGEVLPAATYRLAEGEPGIAALGWLLAQHRFDRYRSEPKPDAGPRVLLTRDAGAIDAAVREAEATALVRDLVDTPAADMGPAELEAAVRAVATEMAAKVEVVDGELLACDYPLIHAVGKGAEPARAPRLIELHWGRDEDPRLAIVGKGVCFDTGGLDLKPASGMRLMKKDMGGAAHALALARLVIGAKLPVRLHLLIAAVENSVSATAFRPGDVIGSRKGLTVEIDNTDAEGRLVLADALDKAGEGQPDLIVDFATLTGAARVALGPDLPAMFANDDALAGDLEQASRTVHDPLWRMPLWDGYADMLKSDIADMANSSDSGFAGSVTAALFLKRFVPPTAPWAHFDTFAWRPSAKPGRPKGGEALGLRAVFRALEARFPR